ncbi:cellulase family glycosylhydrolase [Flavobacterium frigoris]|nr:cellulase family glycosylhydrolase [Flavobacterium frigoris]
MLKTLAFAGPQREIKQKITHLIGAENTTEFYDSYKANGFTKQDVDSLAVWGFNSIRLPMHYNLYTLPIEQETVSGKQTWLEEGFKRTDELLSWCTSNKIYLILDLHATPGGQGKDANISDYDPSKPSLWESTANQDKMVALWEKLATRYKDDPWIGGYDIINEPNWNFSGTNQNGCDEKLNTPLRALQLRITKAIRAIDMNHLVIIEGNCWGNNYNGIFPLWDDNMALSFHKYWNKNDVGSIQKMLDYREKYNVPIWMGEGGENSNVWFQEAINLLESNNIGWAFWPMKKVENTAGITSVNKPASYDTLLEYWEKGGKKPTVSSAKATLMELANNYKLENTVIKYDVIDAMFRQVQTTDTKEYSSHIVPGKIFATDYDLGQNGYAYFDTDVINYDGTKFTKWNKGGVMRNDGVDIEVCSDEVTNGFDVVFIESGEWLQYTIDLVKAQTFDVSIRFFSKKVGGKLFLEDEKGNKLSQNITIPSSGALGKWDTVVLKNVTLKQGTNKVRVHFEKGGFNFNYLEFKEKK